MFNMSPFEMVVIGVVALLVLGPKGLPEMGRQVGRWMKMFREAADEMRRGLYFEEDYRSYTPPRKIESPAPTASAASVEEGEVTPATAEASPEDSQPAGAASVPRQSSLARYETDGED